MQGALSGMMPGLHVHDALLELWDDVCGFAMAVIRSIDSSTNEHELVSILQLHKFEHLVVNGNVCMTPAQLQEALRRNLFTGFDEVWLLDSVGPSAALAQVPSATSDGTDFSEALDPEIVAAAQSEQCRLLLGDGCGLNFLTFDPTIATEVEKLRESPDNDEQR